jgi:phosphatidylinositol alpha-1,6-mannosyltransferase
VSAVPGVLLLTDQFPPAVGGSGELLFNVYARFNGTPVTVLAAQAAGRAVAGPNLRVIRRDVATDQWGVIHPKGLFGHARRTVEVLRHVRGADVIVHCGRALPEGLSAFAARSFGGPPYLCWVHGEELGCNGSSRELRTLMRLIYARAAGVVANSRNTAAALRAFGVHHDRIAVVHPGVDVTRFVPDAPGALELRRQLAPGGELVLLTVGRLQRRKGHDLVIQALAQLLPARTVRYIVVGDGEERESLEQLAERIGVAGHVTFVGTVPPDMLPAYYAAADVFVHPNRIDGHDFEGFGIVFLEAAAAMLPVVAGNTGGAPEAVAAGVTGELVSGTSVPELADTLNRLLGDPERRRQLGSNGRQRVLEQFGWERAATAVHALHATAATQAAT